MDAANCQPLEMIAELARGMMPERRGRFLDAACGNDAELRAGVEARLGDAGRGTGDDPEPTSAANKEPGVLGPVSLESIALEALSAAQDSTESKLRESETGFPDEQPIYVYCDERQMN